MVADVDQWIDIAKECKYLPEQDLKVNKLYLKHIWKNFLWVTSVFFIFFHRSVVRFGDRVLLVSGECPALWIVIICSRGDLFLGGIFYSCCSSKLIEMFQFVSSNKYYLFNKFSDFVSFKLILFIQMYLVVVTPCILYTK